MYCLVANVQSDKGLRTGAKVYVIGYQDFYQVEVVGLNKGGRRITKFIAWKRLTNFRTAFVPPYILKQCRLWWEDRTEAIKIAQELEEVWRFVRAYHPDGRLLLDGVSAGEALREYCKKQNIENHHGVAPLESLNERIKTIRDAGLYYASDCKPFQLKDYQLATIGDKEATT